MQVWATRAEFSQTDQVSFYNQVESAKRNERPVNEGILLGWRATVVPQQSGQCVLGETEVQGMIFLGQVNWEVNTVAVSLVAMTALSPREGLWVCLGEGVCVYV